MIQYARTLNLLGTDCPMNFVMIKNALDSMRPGEYLQARLDKAPIGPDVANSLRECGYEVVSLDERQQDCLLVARKHVLVSRKQAGLRTRRSKDCGCGSRRKRRR